MSMNHDELRQIAEQSKIGLSYYNAYGNSQEISDESLTKLIMAMDTETARNIVKDRLIPMVKIIYEGESKTIDFHFKRSFDWELTLENGVIRGKGTQDWQKIYLPEDLPLGYHQFSVNYENSGNVITENMSIIVAPKRCYEPDVLIQQKKLWGACVQLYTLRSKNNWGIGDFGDLKYFVQNVAKAGGAYVGLNPLHSLFPANPLSASPYAPSSRRWVNVIYIDVNGVDDFSEHKDTQEWLKRADIQERLYFARSAEYVDYSLVQELKLEALKLAFPHFQSRVETDPNKQSFREFVKLNGQSLYQQATFDALHAKLAKHDKMLWGWPVWEESYNDFHSHSVQEFCKHNTHEIEFYLWLQWIAHVQLDECYQESVRLGMPIGLYRDLAVGVGEGGAEIWGDKALYCLGASVGAPPDILGPQGQNWGLPPMHPSVVEDRAYQPYIDLLRANMASCGALRMDHVMGLMRLWWIPYGETADKGAYVHFDVDAYLAILALESQRHQCMVIGEDLGTVPPEIVDKLHNSGVYSYKVAYFENSNNYFKAPHEYPRQAIATITTHDLPTLRGYWQKNDFELGKNLGVYTNDEVLRQLSEDRDWKKQGLLDALHNNGCLPHDYPRDAKQIDMDIILNDAVHQFIAQSTTALIGLQPEDWLDMASPVNIPGTSEEYPNWRRKLSKDIEEIFSEQRIQALLNKVNDYRA